MTKESYTKGTCVRVVVVLAFQETRSMIILVTASLINTGYFFLLYKICHKNKLRLTHHYLMKSF